MGSGSCRNMINQDGSCAAKIFIYLAWKCMSLTKMFFLCPDLQQHHQLEHITFFFSPPLTLIIALGLLHPAAFLANNINKFVIRTREKMKVSLSLLHLSHHQSPPLVFCVSGLTSRPHSRWRLHVVSCFL